MVQYLCSKARCNVDLVVVDGRRECDDDVPFTATCWLFADRYRTRYAVPVLLPYRHGMCLMMDFGSSGDFFASCRPDAGPSQDCQTARPHLEAIPVQDWLHS